jgi:hypothetical protein
MTCAAILNTAGLAATLVGIILLFLFQMPFRIRTDGYSFYAASREDPKERAKDRVYDLLGLLGLLLLVTGTLVQIAAVWL